MWEIIQHGPLLLYDFLFCRWSPVHEILLLPATQHNSERKTVFGSGREANPRPEHTTPKTQRKKKTREKKIKEGEPDTAAAALARSALPLRVSPYKSRPPPPLPCTPSPRRRSPQPLALIAPRPRLAVAPSRSPPRRRGEHPRARPSTAWLVDCLLCSFRSDSIRFDPRRGR